MGQHLPDFAEPRWFVCHTKPRCEKKFDDLMARERFPHYLALIQSVRRYGTQKKTFTKPLFAGYVFARLEPAPGQWEPGARIDFEWLAGEV